MQNKYHISFFTLLLMISFASVNAVLFTPALPAIANFFTISASEAQKTMTCFLIGYALGQLLYGPLANRFGRKPTLYIGISLQILSSILCVLPNKVPVFSILVLGRFLLALGSGVGLKMTFTLVNECYPPKVASEKIAYLILAFAITPGLSVALGGVLNTHFGWASCFYAGAIYGVILLLLVARLPETHPTLDYNALKLKHLLHEYGLQFKNMRLVAGGLLMGCSSSIVYVFAAAAPFIAIHLYNMNSSEYGFANLLPPIGLIIGSLVSAQLAKKYDLKKIILFGIIFFGVGITGMSIAILLNASILTTLFICMIPIYFGLSMIIANSSTVAMSTTIDKAHGSAVLNFINMGFTTLIVIGLRFLPIRMGMLPTLFFFLCVAMMLLHKSLGSSTK
jgi:DHA1 family bicyclomycin/chloramphenicol resistance-like MFS transporter